MNRTRIFAGTLIAILAGVTAVGVDAQVPARPGPDAGIGDVNPNGQALEPDEFAQAAAEDAAAGAMELEEDLEGVQEAVRSEDNLISITVDNVPLEDVVRMFTKLSDANIVATTSNLEGSVTVSLADVEWRPALSSILEMHGLALVEKTPGSGIWSIVAQDPNAGPPMIVQVIRLKFATVGDVAPIVQTMLGEGGGSVSEFPSRNTVIVRATAESIEQIMTLIEEIDIARDQVYIESKFVELNHGASESIGIDWQMLEAYTISATLGYDYSDERVREDAQNDTLNRFDRRETVDDTTKNFDINDV
jgi:type IV pilus assembly protein PilQ